MQNLRLRKLLYQSVFAYWALLGSSVSFWVLLGPPGSLKNLLTNELDKYRKQRIYVSTFERAMNLLPSFWTREIAGCEILSELCDLIAGMECGSVTLTSRDHAVSNSAPARDHCPRQVMMAEICRVVLQKVPSEGS